MTTGGGRQPREDHAVKQQQKQSDQSKPFKNNDFIDFLMKIKPKPFYYNDFIDFFDENQAKVMIL